VIFPSEIYCSNACNGQSNHDFFGCDFSLAAELVLDQNKLTGTLTTEFQSLVHLSFLDLGNNEFLGNFNTVFQGMDTLGK
jgi:hypothetical protein